MTDVATSDPAAGLDSDTTAGLVGAALAVTAWGAGSVLAKYISIGGMAIAVYRFGMFSVIMVAWLLSRGVSVNASVLRKSAAGGIALGVDVAMFFSAVKLTNVVNATLIGSLQPIFVGIVAAKFFGEKINRRDIGWAGLAILGVGLVVTASNGTPEWSAKGDLLAVGAALAWSGYFIASKQSKGKLTPSEFTAGTAIWTAAINIPLALAFGQDLSLPSAENLLWLGVMTLLAGVIGHTMMNWSLVRIPLWVGSTMTLLVPVASSLIAWFVLDEALTAFQVFAMALVLFALGMIVRNQSQRTVRRPAGPERARA